MPTAASPRHCGDYHQSLGLEDMIDGRSIFFKGSDYGPLVWLYNVADGLIN
ncbi:hypothetical protein [Brucella pseudogrignonensis]|uniref:Uncharacterized protein n=1 Tax=Brucella pseudogrignonensis TaxID=419475 RepID=A0ABU1MEA2_9HYPH|nr:hypothetical protein [Brucella pseudogrignonensis]MDR6434336.1 hypothetical protein [Brucella pseudogrignonensis]